MQIFFIRHEHLELWNGDAIKIYSEIDQKYIFQWKKFETNFLIILFITSFNGICEKQIQKKILNIK